MIVDENGAEAGIATRGMTGAGGMDGERGRGFQMYVKKPFYFEVAYMETDNRG